MAGAVTQVCKRVVQMKSLVSGLHPCLGDGLFVVVHVPGHHG